MAVKPKILTEIFTNGGIRADVSAITAAEYAEPFFDALGAMEVSAMDVSPYEGATVLHDLNKPLSDDALVNRFSVVHDGGSLEHVFNFPQALKTCMEMVKLGGHFVQMTPANNLMGHGFWQTSPELVYRVFTPENGFKLRSVLLHEQKPDGAWFEVDDSAILRSRIELRNRQHTVMLTVAQRTAIVPVLATVPQQSFYVASWSGEKGRRRPRKVVRLAQQALRTARSLIPGYPTGFDVPGFRRVAPADVAKGLCVRS